MSFKHTNKQLQALDLLTSSAIHLMLFGGSQSGKTFILLRAILIRAVSKKSRHLIVRHRFNHVKTSIWHDTLPCVLALCFPDLIVRWDKVDFYIELSNGSQIWIAGLDSKERTEKVLGTKYSTIYFNECSQLEYDSVLTTISRISEKSGLTNKIYYDCNPPSQSHWCYSLFILNKDPQTKEKIANPQHYASLLMNPVDNRDNLPLGYIESFLESLPKRQRDRFLKGLFISDIEGALWLLDWVIKAQMVEKCEERVTGIGVDPAISEKEDSDLTGIIVASSDGKRANVLADYSLIASPEKWGQTVINAYNEHEANFIVVEVNQGGDMCKHVLKSIDKNVKVVEVRASKGKFARAEPITAFYERGEIHHAKGLQDLEDEYVTYVPINSKKSPDRLDAAVWVLSKLLLKPQRNRSFEIW